MSKTRDSKAHVLGCVDTLSSEEVAGWAFDPTDPEMPTVVEVHWNGRLVGSGETGDHRHDVAEQYGTSGRHGFSIRLSDADPDLDPRQLKVSVLHDDRLLPLETRFAKVKGGRGLREIAWQEVCRYIRTSRGKRVMLLGQAPTGLLDELSSINGLSVDHIESASPADLSQHGMFRSSSRYDYVLVPAVKGLVAGELVQLRVAEQLCAQGGRIVMECDVVVPEHYAPETNFVMAHRGDTGLVLVPTMRGLIDVVLSEYSTRYIHASVNPGKRVSSHILLCRRRLQTVLVIGGATRSGKSTLARSLLSPEDQYINLDLFLSHLRTIARNGGLPDGTLKDLLLSDQPLLTLYRSLEGSEALLEFADVVGDSVVRAAPRVIIEGVGGGDAFVARLQQRLGDSAYVSATVPATNQ